jgi:hypothetical protein
MTAKMPPSSSRQTKESCYKLKLDFPSTSPSSHHHIDRKNIPLILMQKKKFVEQPDYLSKGRTNHSFARLGGIAESAVGARNPRV